MNFALALSAWAGDTVATVPIQVGEVRTERGTVIPAGLELSACAITPVEPTHAVPTGTLVLEVQVRRGKVSLVTVATAEPSVDAFGPCLTRELAAYTWPVRRGDLRVPVYVGPTSEPPLPALEQP